MLPARAAWLLLVIALPGQAQGDDYARHARTLTEATTATALTAGLRRLIWRMEEMERCRMRLFHGESGGIGTEGYRERWRIDIPLGSIDPDTVNAGEAMGITLKTRSGAPAFDFRSAEAPGTVEEKTELSLFVDYSASKEQLAAALRALARICK